MGYFECGVKEFGKISHRVHLDLELGRGAVSRIKCDFHYMIVFAVGFSLQKFLF